MNPIDHFDGNPSDLVARRASFRTFDRKAIDSEAREVLVDWMNGPPAAPFGNAVSLHLLERFDASAKDAKLGTYGMIRGAVNFLVGAVAPAEHDMEDFGFVFEMALLKATELGLGSCWLGGTLKRGAFASAADLSRDLVVPAVSPLGRAVDRRLTDRAMRFFVGSKKRKDSGLLFFSEDFSKDLDLKSGAGVAWVQALEMLRLGPSASNKQPWRVVAEGDRKRFHFFVQRNAGYERFSSVDLQRVDMGIAMAHFALGMFENGVSGQFVDEPSSAANIELPERSSYIASWISD
ncbi:MAG: nitroreductase [Deltaproteobacteria bacterium]|nr:nitroreductase [Deltaproteobacteria bacterium]